MIGALLWEKFGLRLSRASITRPAAAVGTDLPAPAVARLGTGCGAGAAVAGRGVPGDSRPSAARVGAEIYWGDEAGVRSDNQGGTTWGIKGQTPVVRSTGGRSAVNMISAVSVRGKLRFMLTRDKVNGAVFVEFLQRLMHNARRPVFLILDGASYHRSRAVKAHVASLRGKLRLFSLPPHSPERNPGEQVWNYVKHHGMARAALRGARTPAVRPGAAAPAAKAALDRAHVLPYSAYPACRLLIGGDSMSIYL